MAFDPRRPCNRPHDGAVLGMITTEGFAKRRETNRQILDGLAKRHAAEAHELDRADPLHDRPNSLEFQHFMLHLALQKRLQGRVPEHRALLNPRPLVIHAISPCG
jgi:hypothetical protein